MLSVDQDRLWRAHQEMGKIGALPHGGCCRLALDDDDRRGRELFIRWCREAGCSIRIDRAGNIFARRPGTEDGLPAVATGSHLDTQPHAGLFDGIYGVLSGLEIFRTLNDAGIRTRAPLETIVWTNEECVRFAPPTGGSMVFCGLLPIDQFHAERTTDGTTVLADLERHGFLGNTFDHADHPLESFFEVHIEQGPILEREAKTIGVVIGIQGARMYRVELVGQDNHAGTTPMDMRRDAFDGAARLGVRLNEMARAMDPALCFTIGHFNLSPNAASTVPGEAAFEIDLRHPDESVLDRYEAQMRAALAEIAGQASLSFSIEDICSIPTVRFAGDLVDLVEATAGQLGYSHMRLLSGAGHDSANLAAIAPTAMIFVPCVEGISHNEAEMASPEDLAAGANVLLHSMLARAGVADERTIP
ncbi:MAG: M20 family metallo-hydrolase [Candidatus Andeanibacterium colombiense]|uniref:M20 family metallo-hydrolase n=1 Tax=Candidatus Andeanibacterium colombiense TaxID=3121345 RepID=A0AAJ5X655_9SPHN|nr:MAG: M20 family metallo-hydrolase [Sphingomonadaceae bacterium]